MAENLTLKTTRSEAHYRGTYPETAFDLLATPTRLYRALLRYLSAFGATLQNFKVETPSLADSHVSCSLLDLNTAIRLRLDRLEIDFWKLHEVGPETANRMVVALWTALHEADESLRPAGHIVDLNFFAEVQGGTASDMLGTYVRMPEAVGPMDLGVAFYTPPIRDNTEPWINVVIDRVFRQEKEVLLKTTVGLDGGSIAVESIFVEVGRQLASILERLGIRFADGGQL